MQYVEKNHKRFEGNKWTFERYDDNQNLNKIKLEKLYWAII